MRLSDIVRHVSGAPEIKERISSLDAAAFWANCAAEARPFFCACAWHKSQQKILVVTPTYDRALQWHARLTLCGVPQQRIKILPSGLSVLFDDAAPETVALSDRIGAIRMLAEEGPGIVIATPQAALERTLPADLIRDSFLEINVGDETDIDDIRRRLVRLGYEAAEPVRVPGQFSRRGGILDVFPMGFDRPVRIEFFGDEVDSMRQFDQMTQRSIRSIERLEMAPSRETLLPEDANYIAELLHQTLERERDQLPDSAAEKLTELIEGDIQALEAHTFFDRLDLYRPLLQPDSGCAIDLLGEEGLLVLDDPMDLEAHANRAEEELAQALDARVNRGEIIHSTANDFVIPVEHFSDSQRILAFATIQGAPEWLHFQNREPLDAASLDPYRGSGTALFAAIRSWMDQHLCIVLATDQPTRAKEMLKQVDIFPEEPNVDDFEHLPPGIWIVDGNLAGGFQLVEQKFVLLTDQELFGVGRLKLPQRKFNEGVPISSVLDLKPGDYVVHINFGIGVYQGLVTRTIEGVQREYLHVEYKHPDKLFVPADQLDRIQKYLAPGDDPPKVNRLTGGEWQKTVTKAREEAREFARELIQLYATRKRVTRESFGPDLPWQAEMEHTFPWAETPGQLQAIEDVKIDMQTDYPMDRLICGDVGFGKTEVAIRAAFKAALAKKQVAILCPTTILSEQHYRNFAERLTGFPTKIALINRFCTGKERKEIIEDLENGDIDILIGTHAILSDQLKFKDLGLLIIDEEQKFGVKHKEALKALRANVDVLTLSATPIPRTLSMALMNIREMSVINDPPPGRLPIRTFVRPWSQEVEVEAILKELARGGQVYFVTHQVQGIQHLADRLRKAIPTARIAVGHGQMNEKELEPVMVGFIKGEIDILVSTTIIESGLDISNANTLIVENADRFGLSQLYQIRGRVGRSDRQAYAYFLFSGHKTLTEGASQRLQALSEFSQLGAGYTLAIRDLQIRGAGDLLGAKQSGQMNAIGYDLYTQLIDAEVEFLKVVADGDDAKPLADPLAGLDPLPSLDLPVAAYIPETYIEAQDQRLWYYKRLMGCRSQADLEEAAAEISDRYGMMPEETASAVSIIGLRIRALALRIKQIDGKGGRLAVTFDQNYQFHPRLMPIVGHSKKDAYLSQDKLIWPFVGNPIDACDRCLEILAAAEAQIEADLASIS